jgi:hypothetical protein
MRDQRRRMLWIRVGAWGDFSEFADNSGAVRSEPLWRGGTPQAGRRARDYTNFVTEARLFRQSVLILDF